MGKNIIVVFGNSNSQSSKPLERWELLIKRTNYNDFNHLKRTFPKADYVSHQYTIFDISGNKYRLVTEINYSAKVIKVKRVWTHAEYSLKKNQDAVRENRV